MSKFTMVEREKKAVERVEQLKKVVAQYDIKHNTKTNVLTPKATVTEIDVLSSAPKGRIQLWELSQNVDMFVGADVLATLDSAQINLFRSDFLENKRDKEYAYRLNSDKTLKQERYINITREDFESYVYPALCGIYTGEKHNIDNEIKKALQAVAQLETETKTEKKTAQKKTERQTAKKTTATKSKKRETIAK